MSEIKKPKVYILSSNCVVLSVWTNLTKLTNELNNADVSYFKLYRKIQNLQFNGDVDLKTFKHEFTDANGVEYQITVNIVN